MQQADTSGITRDSRNGGGVARLALYFYSYTLAVGVASSAAALWSLGKKNSKQNQHTRNAGRKKETKPEQETKGDAEESTETRRVPQAEARGAGEA